MSDNKKGLKQTLAEEFASLKDFELADINNLDWNNMGSWPLIGRTFFLVLIFISMIALGYWLLIKEQKNILDRKVQEEHRLKKEYEAKVFSVANIELYREQMDEIQANLYRLLRQLPLAKETPRLIDDISRSAFEGGLELKSINPQATVSKDYYIELPINIHVAGGYHELATFVSNVSALPRIVTLHDFTISSSSDANVLNMQILAKTYQYKEGK